MFVRCLLLSSLCACGFGSPSSDASSSDVSVEDAAPDVPAPDVPDRRDALHDANRDTSTFDVEDSWPDAPLQDTTADSFDAASRDMRLPLGRANFVTAQAVLSAGNRSNGVWLGTLLFDGTRMTVDASMYRWSQSNPARRVSTGSAPAGDCVEGSSSVRVCDVLTVDGFLAEPNEARSGVYRLDTATDGTPLVNIQWGDAAPFWETWLLTESVDGKLVVGTFAGSRRTTHGFLFGSDAPLTERRAMSTIQASGRMTFDYVQWVRDEVVSQSNLTWQNGLYNHCSGPGATSYTMTYFQPSSARSCRSGCEGDTSIQYYIQQVSSFDRRDSFWHWCTCLAQANDCYPPDGNSHVRPMLQILDDQGTFRGWVGVEASFYWRRHTDPRGQDMLQVFRVHKGLE